MPVLYMLAYKSRFLGFLLIKSLGGRLINGPKIILKNTFDTESSERDHFLIE
jgi:hypothetical protein